jgi:two-component system sensor histidine kinase UhpB
MANDPTGEEPVLLSSAPAQRADWQLAVPVVVALLAVFVVTVPFVQHRFPYVWGFIPVYQTALAITDLLTAGLLLAQFNITRSRALLMLGCGYLFAGSMVVPHTLSYPGLFSDTGLLGANPKTTAWLYMFWHGGFPLAVMGYAWLKGRDGELPSVAQQHRGSSRPAILCGIAAVLATTVALTLLSTVGSAVLPPLVEKGAFTTEMAYVAATVWALSPAALVMLWRRRPHSVLDVWLMVVLCAWLFDVALSAVSTPIASISASTPAGSMVSSQPPSS